MVAINPVTAKSGAMVKGHVDPNTNSTAILTAGVKGAFFTLADTASLIGKMAYQVPASLLTTQTNPAVQTGMQIAAAMAPQYDMKRAMVNMAGQALGGLGSLFAGKDQGDEDGPKNKRQERRLAKAEGTWKDKGADIS